ncbi:MAG: TIM barrel protein [Candidatus Brocadiaceae bacterium]|jgi:hydroxypyruvate isomerase
MGRINQSYCMPCFLKEGIELEELIRGSKEIGYAAFEIWHRGQAPFGEMVELARKYDMRIASMSGQRSLTDGLNDPDNHGRIADEVHESIKIAAQHDIPGLIVFSGNRDGRDDEESIEVCAAGLRRVVEAAEKAGVNLNMELLNSKVNHPGYQCDHTHWGVRVCEAVGSPRVKLLYDIYHMAIMEGDLIRTIRDNIEHIGHFHTAGNPGRGPLDENQEIYYPAVCRAIADTGYVLYVGHEFGVQGDPLEALADAYETCDV